MDSLMDRTVPENNGENEPLYATIKHRSKTYVTDLKPISEGKSTKSFAANTLYDLTPQPWEAGNCSLFATNKVTFVTTKIDSRPINKGRDTVLGTNSTLYSAKTQPKVLTESTTGLTEKWYLYDIKWSKTFLKDKGKYNDDGHWYVNSSQTWSTLTPNIKNEMKESDFSDNDEYLTIDDVQLYQHFLDDKVLKPILKGRQRIKVQKLDDLSESDPIAFNRGLYKHHAIVVSIDLPLQRFIVIELTGNSGGWLESSSSKGGKANVAFTALNFKDCSKIYKYRYDLVRSDNIHPIDVATLLFDKSLPQNYRFLKFNCEHFVTYCMTGIPFSKQVNNIAKSINLEAKVILDRHVQSHIGSYYNRKPALPSRPISYPAKHSKNLYTRRKWQDQLDYHQYSPLKYYEPEQDYPGYSRYITENKDSKRHIDSIPYRKPAPPSRLKYHPENDFKNMYLKKKWQDQLDDNQYSPLKYYEPEPDYPGYHRHKSKNTESYSKNHKEWRILY